MNGLQYLIFLNGINAKAIMNHLSISEEQMINWVNCSSSIPERYICDFVSISGVEEHLIKKEVTEVDMLRIKKLILERDKFWNPQIVDYSSQLSLFPGRSPIYKQDEDIEKIESQLLHITEKEFKQSFDNLREYEDESELILFLLSNYTKKEIKFVIDAVMDELNLMEEENSFIVKKD